MIELKIAKQDAAEPERRMVYAEVYAPNRPDSDGEFMSAETIYKMAHDFVRSGKLAQVDVQHENQTTPGVQIVESFIARKDDPDFIPGSWVVGIHVPDDRIWGQIKKGELNGLSVEALVGRVEREVEIEIPNDLTGMTTKADDGHEHKFMVTYDEDGNFLGGRTDFAAGHMHAIKGGTHTEPAQGHTHRFSAVDQVQIVS